MSLGLASSQLSLLDSDKSDFILKNDVKNWGTFKDSLRFPVHRWFTYPAGFSYRAVDHSLKRFHVTKGMTVYDPFMGSATTNLSAKFNGVHSVGVEAHPFVYHIAKAKMTWNLDAASVTAFIEHLNTRFANDYDRLLADESFALANCFPELLLKCYPQSTLTKLFVLRQHYERYPFPSEKEKQFIFVVITALLRNISSAATGWPYIAPKKAKVTSEAKEVLVEFNVLAQSMLADLDAIKSRAVCKAQDSKHHLILGNSADVSPHIADESVDHVFTSPPYLNNFDYSDRTRLELYFWGWAKSWGDITSQVRSKLMTSATTQITRSNPRYILHPDFIKTCPAVAGFVQDASSALGELRKVKGGKKSYDLMVTGYFNDMYNILHETYRVMKPNTQALFVLGDSAPYGVHVPTDELIGQIGCAVGFRGYEIEILRKRGDKWKANPQRHMVPLRESIVMLKKN